MAGGSDDVKKRVVRNTTNAAINEIARTCPSFRPVEVAQGERGSDMFYHSTGEVMYVAIFNFEHSKRVKHLPLQRLGLVAGCDYSAVELWSGQQVKFKNEVVAEIGGKDVKVYKIEI